MRTTVDIPDDLFRRAKSEAALRGRKLKDLVEEGLRLVLEKPADRNSEEGQIQKPNPSAHDVLKEWCGSIQGGPGDMATNPKYFDDFGR